MSKFTKFRSPVPEGMRIFAHGVEVAEDNHCHRYARKFVKRSKRRVYLQREPENKHDFSAIRVMGESTGWIFGARRCIGYVPADLARKLVITGIDAKVEARLRMILVDGKDAVKIRFDLLGPADDYEKYSS
ncbi:MAG: HIRAN domain-containing protein [Gammaproteobacteria bacterium]